MLAKYIFLKFVSLTSYSECEVSGSGESLRKYKIDNYTISVTFAIKYNTSN